MDAATARTLLAEIKQAGYSGIAGYLPGFSGSSPLSDEVHKHYNQKLQRDAVNSIIKALGLGLGAGAAVRGISALRDTHDKKIVAPSVVDMPVPYSDKSKEKEQEKTADNQKATNRFGLNYYMPSLVLGTPLAAYGGWKAVDAVLKARQKAKTDRELEEAKQDYEEALIGAYKKSTDEVLDSAFDLLEKNAFSIDNTFPNLSGALQGAALTYVPLSLLGGYALVNNRMEKGNQKKLIEKALRERALRHEQQQPSELYARPFPIKDEEGENGENATAHA